MKKWFVLCLLPWAAVAQETNTPAAPAAAATAETTTATPVAGDDFKINGDAARGGEIYKIYCVACHGETGKGDGITAAALDPKPADHTNKEVMSKLTDKEIFTAIKDGGVAVGKSPMMTPWGPLLKDDQKIHDVAAYVRSLAK